jgi:trehalose 6-phosphate phosphatase
MSPAETRVALSWQTHAFLFDFDGTLADIAPLPELACVPEELVRHLVQLRALVDGAVGLVTGRPLAWIDARLEPHRFAAAGVHGLELRLDPSAEPKLYADGARLGPLRASLRAFARLNEGIVIEDKGPSIALHYRQRPELAAEAAAFADALVNAHAGAITLQTGKMVIELRCAGPTKADAVRLLAQASCFVERVPAYFGDDDTDEAAFEAVQSMGGVGIFIGDEARPSCARARLGSPAEMRRLVARLARREQVALTASATAFRPALAAP